MSWLQAIRVYWPALVALVTSLLIDYIFAPLRDNPLTISIFEVLRWVPLFGVVFSMIYGGWITLRLWQAERGLGPLCPRCGGPLGAEKYAPYSPHRTCLVCGEHANERHYN